MFLKKKGRIFCSGAYSGGESSYGEGSVIGKKKEKKSLQERRPRLKDVLFS